MEGSSEVKDDLALGGVEIELNFLGQFSSGCDLDFNDEEYGFDASKNRLRSLFDQLLPEFLRNKGANKLERPPLTVMHGDGRKVDLFKLFCVVRKIGGYEEVSRKFLWKFVARECGFGVGGIASAKVIYRTYLSELDQFLWQAFSENKMENGIVRRLELFFDELTEKFRCLMNEQEEMKEDGRVKGKTSVGAVEGSFDMFDGEEQTLKNGDEQIYSGNDDNFMVSTSEVSGKVTSRTDDTSKTKLDNSKGKCGVVDDIDFVVSNNNAVETIINKDDGFSEGIAEGKKEMFSFQNRANVPILEKCDAERDGESRKRKRHSSSMQEMLNWLIHAAKHSDDPSIGRLPDCSKWKDHGNEDELWFQALSVRESCRIRRSVDSNAEESVSQKKLQMHPSMYEDVSRRETLQDLRCSQRLSSMAKPHFCSRCHSSVAAENKGSMSRFYSCSCRNSCSASKDKADSPTAKVRKGPKVSLKGEEEDTSADESTQKQVPVGPLFQAEVPDWTGPVLDSDSKWLGVRMWPNDNDEEKCIIEHDPIGKGRDISCECPVLGSVPCVRLHIAEKRFKLKEELGPVFNRWRFDRMGEEVSLSWTIEEENRFKDLIRANAATPNKFWKNASKYFPSKSRQMLVSYYFNVYLVQRRSYQNRACPKEIESDDDEEMTSGSIGGRFGHRSLFEETESLICSQNEQCFDFD